jgi:hypothetical protein
MGKIIRSASVADVPKQGRKWWIRNLAVLGTVGVTLNLLLACTLQAPPSEGGKTGAPVTKTVGASGGVVTTPDGVTVDIPAGALPNDVQITVTPAPADAPAPTAGTVVGPAYVFGPPGTVFKVPVTVTLPIDPAKLGTDPLSEVQVGGAPDGQTEFHVFNALASDETHVKFMTQHFTVFVPTYFHDCGIGGPDFYDACAATCNSGYHQTTAAFVGCTGSTWGLANEIHCMKNGATGSSYDSCNELGCAIGYHFIGAGSNACTASIRCALTEGASYDACTIGCDQYYHRTGPAQSLGCGVGGGSHCVSDSGADIKNVCTGSVTPGDGGASSCTAATVSCAGGAPDAGQGGGSPPTTCTTSESCSSGHTYSVMCDCAAGACECQVDGASNATTLVNLGGICNNLGGSVADTLYQQCKFPVPGTASGKDAGNGTVEGGASDSSATPDAGGMGDGGGPPPPIDAGAGG